MSAIGNDYAIDFDCDTAGRREDLDTLVRVFEVPVDWRIFFEPAI